MFNQGDSNPWSTAAEAISMPDPEPITITSNFSVTTPHYYKRRRGKANKLFNKFCDWKIFYASYG